MKRVILTVFLIALSALIFLQCSQTAPTAPDTKQENLTTSTNSGGHPAGPTPVTLGEEDTFPGGGP